MDDCYVNVHLTTLNYLNTGTVHVLKDGAHVKNVGRYSLEKYLKFCNTFFNSLFYSDIKSAWAFTRINPFVQVN